MSVKSFKFVSPGVFINEIDNSFIPTSPEAIGPVVIGRARRGLSMQPVKVESYSDFVEMFGDTVPGMGGGDIYRNGNYQSPMYGTYAAKAFLNANVAPLTYIRLLGEQTALGSTTAGDAAAGWKTQLSPTGVPSTNGGAYGLWVFTSGAAAQSRLGTGSLAATWYINQGEVYLSGTIYGGSALNLAHSADVVATTGSNNVIIGTDSENLFTLVISGGIGSDEKISFSLDDSKSNFIRKVFNTNPQLVSSSTFYTATTEYAKTYWLGETYEQELRDRGMTSGALGCVMAISKGTEGPYDMESNATVEGTSGWFIGQDLGAGTSYVPFRSQRLFRLVGRGHGEWLQKNCKVSIANIRPSTTTVSEFGTFSILIRNLHDTDNAIEILERFDNLNLDPTSPSYVARAIGNKYMEWDTTNKVLKTYGDYDNNSKFVYVEMNTDVDAGATDDSLLPLGYFGPPRFRAVYDLNSTGACNLSPLGTTATDDAPQGVLSSDAFLTGGSGIVAHDGSPNALIGGVVYLSGGGGIANLPGDVGSCTGSLVFPQVRLRVSASDGGLSDQTDAYFGMQTTRTATSTTPDASVADFHGHLYSGYSANGARGATGGGTNPTAPYGTAGVEDYAYVFSLDDLTTGSSGIYYYQSGSRTAGSAVNSSSATTLDAGYNKFTAPFFGGFDGFNIMKPDPLYNGGMAATSTEDTSYVYHTFRRAIDTVADPEFVDMNLLTVPGLTNDSLTGHMINVCEDRADALALVDLASVYIPPHERYYANKSSRIGTTPTTAATALKDRRIDSSYGATFYPWVQTRDENTGIMLWIPPTVAMMGVLASSEASSELWFAPAGFNRGGLSKGAAGIPITGITQRLTSKERDTLYESRINPIASFPSNGLVVFGQKTLQERQSALDRINVRRLVIYMKKQISILSTQILFEQNVQATWNRFIALIEPFLANIKVRFGITDYKLILDESTTTPDLIDQNILYAKIMIKPARAIEYIAIDFVIMSTGASFED